MQMSDAAKTARREYMRQWWKKNRSKNRLYQNRYWERRAAKQQQAQEV